MRDQVLWRKTGRIADRLADCLDIDAEHALDILYNSRTYTLLANPDSGLQLQSDAYILADLLHELEAGETGTSPMFRHQNMKGATSENDKKVVADALESKLPKLAAKVRKL